MIRKAILPPGAFAPAVKSWKAAARGALDRATLAAHAAVVRLDGLPQEFGDGEPVDQGDPQALRREWLRQARLWASYNPEGVFAFKAALLMGGVAILAVLAVVSIL